MAGTGVIRTPDQRLRVFVSSSLPELAAERQAVHDAVTSLRLVPVMFELGARPYPPAEVYRAYLAQSQVFVGVYWQSYGWVPPGAQISGLEDEYRLSVALPRLIYVKSPAPDREDGLSRLLDRIREDGDVSYNHFSDPAELRGLLENDLAVLLSERFETGPPRQDRQGAGEMSSAGAVPVPATPLVGRQQETEAICDMILAKGARLVTVTGPGGVGKTRLAVEVAARLGPSFVDGVRFVDLGACRTADLVPAAVAAGLGLNTSGARLLADVESYLRPRQLLLMLDNFEQVTAAAPLVAELLGSTPGLVVLVTSRVLLRLRGEHEFPVGPLAVPPPGASNVRQYDSIRLFEERAHAATPRFELTAANSEAVAEICRRLDGLPLAIELAAARIRLLPPAALLARLDDPVGLLTGGLRDAPERQRTLKATLDWSFALLSTAEQELFARLGVFAGTFSLRAAEAIGPDTPPAAQAGGPEPLVETLTSLVDSSLVRPAEETDDADPRFGLLEVIRQYALDRLPDRGEWDQTHDRHAGYFLALADPVDAELHGRGQLAWLNRLEIDHDNLRAALTWLVESGQLQEAVQLFWTSWRFWWLHGHIAELAGLAEKIVDGSGHLPSSSQAMALAGTGFIFIANGDTGRGQALFEMSLPSDGVVRDKLAVAVTATALASLGRLATLRRDYPAASALLEESQAMLGTIGDNDLTGVGRSQQLLTAVLADNYSGQIRLDQGDYNGAGQQFIDGLQVARQTQDRVSILVSLYDLALSTAGQGDLTGASQHVKEGLSLAAEAGDQPTVGYYLEHLAAVAKLQDDPQRAVRLLAAARAMLQTSGSGWLHAYVPLVRIDQAALDSLRTRVGNAEFQDAWTSGEFLEGSQAVKYALG